MFADRAHPAAPAYTVGYSSLIGSPSGLTGGGSSSAYLMAASSVKVSSMVEPPVQLVSADDPVAGFRIPIDVMVGRDENRILSIGRDGSKPGETSTARVGHRVTRRTERL
jgi:hypothetical protein